MRVLFIAGYQHPVYHRKIELLADSPDVKLLHITHFGSDRASGFYPSANGKSQYELRQFPAIWLAGKEDPHRSLLRTFDFCMHKFQPDIVQAESDIETLGTAQVALATKLFASKSKVVLFTWQNILRPRRRSVKMLVNWILGVTNHIFCANSEAVQVLRQQQFRGSTSIVPLFGVDNRYTSLPAPDIRQELNLKGIVIGYVGRLVADKGVELLLQAVARLESKINLGLVGDGPNRKDLETLAIELGLHDRCKFVGNLPYEAVMQHMKAMDILVLPSRTTIHWKEQFGRVLVEAMACSVVVVGSNSGAIPEVIGDAGRIFLEGDLDALTLTLSELIGQPELRQSLAELGRQRVADHYSVEQIALQTLTTWRQLTSQNL